jgi:hypothetical protein
MRLLTTKITKTLVSFVSFVSFVVKNMQECAREAISL